MSFIQPPVANLRTALAIVNRYTLQADYGSNRDKTSMIALRAHPWSGKREASVLQGLDSGKGRDAEHGTPQGVSMFDPMFDSGSINEGKDVAGMAE